MNKLIIHADEGRHRINKNIYGHFAEHLGRCIYEGFWVGEDSPIPNTRGIRNDVVALLKKIKPPVLRWPGGCFADEYHWRDGIGNRASRPAMVNTHWGGETENNDFGTHEFFDLCEMLECEPYICGNVGSGEVREMAQWIEYCTHPGGAPMSEERKCNGRKSPWTLKYFGIGNESWGCGGNMTPEFYADQYRRYQTFVRNFGDNQIFKIACGANGNDYQWTETLMERAAGMMDGLSLHFYTVADDWNAKGSSTNFDESQYFSTLKKCLQIEELIARHNAIMDKHDPQKRVAMIVDEWGTWWDVEPKSNPGFLYQQNTMRDALVAALSLHVFNSHCERVQMANIAQTANVLQAMILTDGAQAITTPTYHVFDLLREHQNATLLPHDLAQREYSLHGETMPALSVSASLRDEKIHVTIAHCDPHQNAEIEIEIRGAAVSNISAKVLSVQTMNAHNTFQNPVAVAPRALAEKRLMDGKVLITLPPMSLVQLQMT